MAGILGDTNININKMWSNQMGKLNIYTIFIKGKPVICLMTHNKYFFPSASVELASWLMERSYPQVKGSLRPGAGAGRMACILEWVTAKSKGNVLESPSCRRHGRLNIKSFWTNKCTVKSRIKRKGCFRKLVPKNRLGRRRSLEQIQGKRCVSRKINEPSFRNSCP